MPIREDWSHCPHCGELIGVGRSVEEYCEHEFTIEGPYCVRCGYDPSVGNYGECVWYLCWGALLAIAGIGCAFVLLASLTGNSILIAPPASQKTARTYAFCLVGAGVLSVLGVNRLFRGFRLER